MTFLTKQAGAVSCLAITVSGLAVGVLAAPADAAPGDGTITVAVSRDFSGDGRYDADVDQPQAGIEVSVSDAAGTIVSGTTDANGEFVVTPSAGLSGGRYLLETAVPSTLDHLQLAPATAATGPNAYRSATTFVDVGDGIDQTVRVGVWNPSDYLPLDPDYILAVQPSRSSSDGSRTLVRSNWVNRGDGNGNGTNPNTLDITTLATKGQTGSLFGVAWAGPGDRVFSAAYAKAMVPYGPGGAGGVYVTNADAGTPNASLYVTIPNAGTSVHEPASANRDDPFFAAAGTESLGGIAVSDDGSTLYVVNMADKRLYEIDASGSTGSITDSYQIADPGCEGGEWRPGAVTVRDGEVYVGGVCDASASADRADLRAYVQRLGGASFATVLSQPLDFGRGQAENGGTAVSRQWNPWRMAWSRAGVDGITTEMTTGGANVKYPTPLLTSLEFDTDGSLFLGFRDRFSDQIGAGGHEPGTTSGVLVSAISAGDLNKACRNADGSYSWEGTNGCPDNTLTTPDGGQTGVMEFFAGDWISLSGSATSATHAEIAQGGMAYAPRNGEVGSIAMDPTGIVGTGGLGFFNTTTGEGPGGLPTSSLPQTRGWLVNTYPESFGKGNGLGDLDLIGTAPVQIGNRTWFDADKDGVQDADEPALPGVTVRLVDGNGNVVATTTTNANGEYYFGGDGADYQLVPGADYVVRFDISTADTSSLPGSPPASVLGYSTVGSGRDDLDSDPTPTGASGVAEVAITAPFEPGAVDHSIDAGVVVVPPKVSVGDFVWIDTDQDGIQDPGEPGIAGVVLVVRGPDGNPVTDVFGGLVGPATTDPDGRYSFDDLPVLPAGEHYTVSIDRDDPSTQEALAPYVPTQPGQGGDRGKDSSTWTAESGDLTNDGDRDPTLDFGFVPVPVAPPVTPPVTPPGTPPVSPPVDKPTPTLVTEATDRVRARIRPDGSMVPVALRDRVRVSGVGAGARGVARLYGPVTSPSRKMCTSANLVRSVSFKVQGRSTMTPAIKVDRPGYYTWMVRVTTSDGAVVRHRCGLPGETTLVRRPQYGPVAIETGRGPGLARRATSPSAKVTVPGAGIDATVRTSGLSHGAMVIPRSAGQAGWLYRSAQPGDKIGTTVIAAHVSNYHDRPLAFWNLKKVRAGQVVTIRNGGGVYRYRVTAQQRYHRLKGIPKSVFRTAGAPRLVLVSCTDKVTYRDGGFHYRKNLVVIAKLMAK